MIKSLLIFFLSTLTFSLNSQVTFSTQKHDFGDLEPYSARYVDLTLKNIGPKQEWILSIKKPFEVVYITSKQIIDKDSSVIVRLQVNPKVKGRFNYEVEIFTSDRNEATKVKLVGNLREVDQNGGNGMTACPSFGERPGGRNPNDFDLTVVTVDQETREPLSKSTVTMIQGGRPVWQNKTDRSGKVKEESTLGLSYFYATHDGYYPAELGAYVNFKRNYIVIELEKDASANTPPPVIIEDTTVIAQVPEEPEEETEIVIEIEETLEEELATPIDESIKEEIPELAELDPNNFEDRYFDPVNVVFVLDVSSSMKQADKMELMKYSLFQLTDMLRAQDKLGIVTYSTDAKVMLKPTTGDQKDAIKDEVSNLKSYGFTAGGKGIKLGYKQAIKAKIDGGVNHVIVITDGAFNRESDDYKRYVKKYRRKGINLSVVGIKNKTLDEQEMRDAANLGGGNYVPIFKLADAQNNLKQEIRKLTFKR